MCTHKIKATANCANCALRVHWNGMFFQHHFFARVCICSTLDLFLIIHNKHRWQCRTGAEEQRFTVFFHQNASFVSNQCVAVTTIDGLNMDASSNVNLLIDCHCECSCGIPSHFSDCFHYASFCRHEVRVEPYHIHARLSLIN